MTQEQRLDALIAALRAEDSRYADWELPCGGREKRSLLRGLLNMRPARPVAKELLQLQDEYLRGELARRGVVSPTAAAPTSDPRLYIWQGDITRLAADAIVNAANNALLGCFVPCHGCIDNAIHSAAGVQLRLACAELIQKQGAPEKTGTAKITPGFNLPAKYVIHTVGPIIYGQPAGQDCDLLAACYNSCLALAAEYELETLALCCISTGEFHFPQERAAEIAVRAVKGFTAAHSYPAKVIFNVFKDTDHAIYKRILG